MMTYSEWIARGPAVCNAECAQAMGWKEGVDFFGYPEWIDSKGEPVFHIADRYRGSYGWSPTTDRNHTARMVETVRKEGLDNAFGVELVNRLGLMRADEEDGSKWIMVEDAVAVAAGAPSLVAYCAWRALRSPDEELFSAIVTHQDKPRKKTKKEEA